MSKQFIQLAGFLFMLAAILAVSAQESMTSLNNATMNNITLLNNTTTNASVIEAPILPTETANETASVEIVSAENESALAAGEIIPVQNEAAVVQNETTPVQDEAVLAQNVTLPENITVAPEPVSTATTMPANSRLEVVKIESPRMTAFALGGGETAQTFFTIDGRSMPQAAYEVGLPAKTIMDLSKMPFFV